MNRTLVPLLSCSVLLLGCGDDGGTPAAPGSTGAPTASTTAAQSSTGTPGTGASATGTTDGTTGEDPDSSGESGCVSAAGPTVLEDLTLTAADGTSLAATVARPTDGSCLPAVLLVHQYLNDRTQWADEQAQFVAAGYIAVAIDLRGHGESDPAQGELSSVLTDPDQAPTDVAAGVGWLAEQAEIDTDRMAVVGTSIGANLSVVALHQGLVATAVAVSPRRDPVLSLAGSPASLSLDNLFCLAAQNDGGGDQASSCTEMVGEATGQTRLEIIADSALHGVAIFEQFPRTTAEVISWLDRVL